MFLGGIYRKEQVAWNGPKFDLTHLRVNNVTTQKMKFSIKDFFSKCDQIRSFLIWSHKKKGATNGGGICIIEREKQVKREKYFFSDILIKLKAN